MGHRCGMYVRELYLAQEGRCFYCDCLIDPVQDPRPRKPLTDNKLPGWTKDHVIPKLENGENGNVNIVLACWDCNQEKGARLPTMEELRRFHWLRRKMGHHSRFLETVRVAA